MQARHAEQPLLQCHSAAELRAEPAKEMAGALHAVAQRLAALADSQQQPLQLPAHTLQDSLALVQGPAGEPSSAHCTHLQSAATEAQAAVQHLAALADSQQQALQLPAHVLQNLLILAQAEISAGKFAYSSSQTSPHAESQRPEDMACSQHPL